MLDILLVILIPLFVWSIHFIAMIKLFCFLLDYKHNDEDKRKD